jgi:hypothetical protein
MLQIQLFLTSIEDLKQELKQRDQELKQRDKRIETQNQTILDQNRTILEQTDYLVKVTQKNEHVKQLAQEKKLKRLTATKTEFIKFTDKLKPSPRKIQ